MSRKSSVTLVAASAAGALILAGCGGSDAGAAAPPQGPPTPVATVPLVGGIATEITLDAGTLAALSKAKVKIDPVAPATFTTRGGATVARFPITGGDVFAYAPGVYPQNRGDVFHSGGITITYKGKKFTARTFDLNPGTSEILATASGRQLPLFFADGRNQTAGPGPDGTLIAEGTIASLDPVAAKILNSYFGTSLFTPFLTIGVVKITVKAAELA